MTPLVKGMTRHALLCECRGYGLDIETAGIERLREYVKLMRDVPAADRAAAVEMVNPRQHRQGRAPKARGAVVTRGGYDVRMQVKQFVGEVVNSRGARFRVLETGDARWYLFCQLDADGCDTTLHFPVRKKDLIDPCRKALRAGVSFDHQAYRRLLALQDAS